MKSKHLVLYHDANLVHVDKEEIPFGVWYRDDRYPIRHTVWKDSEEMTKVVSEVYGKEFLDECETREWIRNPKDVLHSVVEWLLAGDVCGVRFAKEDTDMSDREYTIYDMNNYNYGVFFTVFGLREEVTWNETWDFFRIVTESIDLNSSCNTAPVRLWQCWNASRIQGMLGFKSRRGY